MGKAPLGPLGLLEVQFTLPVILLLLLPDVLAHSRFIQAHRTHAIPGGPKMQARHPSFLQQLAVDANCTLAFQKPNRVSHAVLGRDAQAHVDMVGQTMPFQQLDSSLATKLSKNRPNLPLQTSVKHATPKLWYDHHVVLTFPPHVGKALPVVHRSFLPAPTGLPGRTTYAGWQAHAPRIAPKLFGSHGQRPWV